MEWTNFLIIKKCYVYLNHESQHTKVTETVVAIYHHAERHYNPDCQKQTVHTNLL